jgi:endogenous inhibitor of DNA gyrase (YacG/DUF329 family)
VTKRKNYPKPCAFWLDERDGRLWCGEHDIAPVPVSLRWQTWERIGTDRARLMRAAVGHGWHLYAIYRCQRCGRWAAGSGFLWCSDECRRSDVAQQARDRRAQRATAARPMVNCSTCGAPIEAQRATRKFCSNRCRQAAHRASVSPALA